MIGSDSSPALARSSAAAVSTALDALAYPNSPMKNCGWARCASSTAASDRVDLVGGLVGLAADLELDQRCVAVLRRSGPLALVERRANVLNRLELRDPRHDVLDRGREGGIGRRERAALDEDALVGGPLEAGVEDPIHATRLARPGGVRVDRLRPGQCAETEGDDDEREPAERRRLPVVGAPTSHARRQVVGGLASGHELPPWGSRTHATDGTSAAARFRRREAGFGLVPTDDSRVLLR